MIDLMADREVLAKLNSPLGRQDLIAYGFSAAGHAHLSQIKASSDNSFVQALLSNILYEAALNASNSDNEILFQSNLVPSELPSLEFLPVTVKPRKSFQEFQTGSTIDFVDDLLKNYGVNKADREWITSDLSNNFYSMVKTLVINGNPRMNSDWESLKNLWDAFDSQATSNNEYKMIAKINRCYIELLEYLYSTREVCRRFVELTSYRAEHDWSDFVANGPPRAGVLAFIATKYEVNDSSWKVIEERSKTSFIDRLLLAIGHPNMAVRDAAALNIEEKMSGQLDKPEAYAVAEVADLLPARMTHTLLPALQTQIEDSWNTTEIGDWRIRLSAWSPTASGTMGPSLISSKPPRWWQRKR